MSAESISLVRTFYEAFARGDFPAAIAGLDAAVEWHETEVSALPMAGTHRGPEGVARGVFRSAIQWDDFAAVPDVFLDAGEYVVVLGRFHGRGRTSGHPLDAPFAHVWRLRNGRIAYVRNYTDTAQFLESLGQL